MGRIRAPRVQVGLHPGQTQLNALRRAREMRPDQGATIRVVSMLHNDHCGIRVRQNPAQLLAASRGGDFTALLSLLDPDVVLRADAAAVRMGAQIRSPGAQGARIAMVDGMPGAVWSVGGRPRVVFDFTVASDKVVAIDLLADPEDLAMLDLALN